MKLSGRYSPGLYAGVAGILGLILINAFSVPQGLQQASERDRMVAEAELEKLKAEQAKKVADAYSKNGIAQFDQLIIKDYTLSHKPPKVNWARTVDPKARTIIFDQNRLCIGYAEGGKFYFTKYYQGVCEYGI